MVVFYNEDGNINARTKILNTLEKPAEKTLNWHH